MIPTFWFTKNFIIKLTLGVFLRYSYNLGDFHPDILIKNSVYKKRNLFDRIFTDGFKYIFQNTPEHVLVFWHISSIYRYTKTVWNIRGRIQEIFPEIKVSNKFSNLHGHHQQFHLDKSRSDSIETIQYFLFAERYVPLWDLFLPCVLPSDQQG